MSVSSYWLIIPSYFAPPAGDGSLLFAHKLLPLLAAGGGGQDLSPGCHLPSTAMGSRESPSRIQQPASPITWTILDLQRERGRILAAPPFARRHAIGP